MLSRICCLKGSNVNKYIKQFYVPAAVASTYKTGGSKSKSVGVSGQRDLVNFPRPTRLVNTPPVVFGFIPKSWFDFFYAKTGVTGKYSLKRGYTFLFALSVYLLSKEIIVISSEFPAFVSVVILFTAVPRLVPEIRQFLEKTQMEMENELNASQEKEKQTIRDTIEIMKKNQREFEGLATLVPEAKRENVYLQQEAAYRMYLKEAHLAVLNILKYNVEKSNVERLFIHKNLISWVLHNVEKSVTSDLKKLSLERAISDLKAIAGGR